MNEWHPYNIKWLFLTIGVVVADQIAKFTARKMLLSYVPLKIFSWLNLSLAFNKGAAFSFLNNQPDFAKWALICIAILIIGYLLIWIFQTEPHKKLLLFALSLILGGAVGNLIDRFWLGYVTDFIDFHIKTWHFATFNLADAAISIGAVMLVLLLLLRRD